MPVKSVRIPDELNQQLSRRGVCFSRYVCGLIESELQTFQAKPVNAQPHGPVSIVGPRANAGRLVNITIGLTESEHEAVRLRKRLHNTTKTGWIVRTIRAALTRAPVLDEDATEAVKESNYQLLAIGKNVNQIARRLNEKQTAQVKALELDELRAIRQTIEQHVNTVNALLDAANGRGALS